MRIAIVAPLVSLIREPHRGGSQVFVADLASGLVERGHQLDLYAATGSAVTGVNVIDTGVDHVVLQSTLYRASGTGARGTTVAESAFAGVYGAIRATGYDVVHNHAFDAPAVALATGLDAPVVHTLHLPPDAEVADALRRAAAAGDRPPAVACVSGAQARAWRTLVPVDAVVPSLVPTRSIPFSPGPGRGAVFAGRFSAEKGAAEAIEIARTAGTGIDLFGNSYDDDYTRAMIEPRGEDRGVVVHPGVSRATLWQAMGRAAVVLCPAGWEEPFGMVAAEAQACGTPVVAFRRGALAEVVVDGLTGFLVAPGDIRGAADAVRRAPELSRRECRAHAERQLDLTRTLDAHEHLYRRLVGLGAGSQIGG
jgi:glycosyltransferase involved in cell wall biosynthesis